jgi:hypothetical protein
MRVSFELGTNAKASFSRSERTGAPRKGKRAVQPDSKSICTQVAAATKKQASERSDRARGTRRGVGHCCNMPERKGPRQLDESSLKAEQYRNRAAELAAIAEETKDPKGREILERLSRDYLKMAAQMDQVAAINRQLHIAPKG